MKFKKDSLNIIPLIDVMLVLLCIVLSVSTFISTGHIKLTLPDAKSVENSDQKELITININGENRFFLGDRAVNFEELKLGILALDKKQNIEIRSDENASFGSFIRLIDLLKINNYENFQIAVKKK